MAKKNDLLAQRKGIFEQAKALLDKAEEENRNLNSEENAQYERMMSEMDDLKERSDRMHAVDEFEREMRESADVDNPARRAFTGEGESTRMEDPYATDAYRDAWASYITGGVDSLRAVQPFKGFQIGVVEKGGMFAPTTIEKEILDFTEKHNVMRQLATVRTSTDNRQINLADQHVVAYWMEEGEAFQETEATFNKDVLNAYKLGALTKFTHESLQDMVGINAEQYIREDFGKAIAALEETAFISGDGVKKPKGFTVDCAANVMTAAAATAFTTDELIQLQHKHAPNRRKASTWLVSDEALMALRMLKDADQRYIWQPALTAGAPDMVLGNKLYSADGIDGVAKSKTPIWFGDFSKYRIQDRRGVYMQRLVERYADEGKIGLIVYRRLDGKMVDNTAIAGLKMAAV